MEIICSHDLKRKQLPPQNEVEKIVAAACKLCNFDPSMVRLNYVGGDRRKFFSGEGMKLAGFRQFAVRAFIGCKEETVETFFHVRVRDNHSMRGGEVYSRMTRAFGGRTFRHTNGAISNIALNSNGSSDKTQETAPSQEQIDHQVEGNKPPEIHAPAVGEDPTTEKEQQTTVYKRYFDDPQKLHLVAFALVTLCNEDTTVHFTFKQFEQVLEEARVPKSAGLSLSMLRPFLAREFVKKVTPLQSPQTYRITEEAIEFARGDAPDATVKIKKPAKQPVTGPKHTETEVVLKNARDIFIRFRKVSDRHQAVMAQLVAAKAKLAVLQKVDIEKELMNLEGQETDLRKRLKDIDDRRLVLAERRSDIASTDKEIASLTAEAEDPEVKQALTKLEELRKLLG